MRIRLPLSDEDRTILGELLAARMEEVEYSVRDMAAAYSISTTTVVHARRGERVKLDTLVDLLTACDLHVDIEISSA